MAAVGRKNCRIARPAVTLSASVAPAEQQPGQHEHVVAVPEGRAEPPQPGRAASPRPAPPRTNQPTKLATSGPRRRSARARRSSRCPRRSSARRPRTTTSPWSDLDHDRGDGLGGLRPAPASVSAALNDEFGTTSGLMSSAASIRSVGVQATGHPAGQARPGLGDLGVAQLGAQRAHRGRARPPCGRSASARLRARASVAVRPSAGRGRRSRGATRARPRAGRRRTSVSTRATRCSKASLLLVRRSRSRCRVVKSYCGATASRAAARAASVCAGALEFDVRLGRDDVARREVARGQDSGCWGRMSAPRIAVRTRTRIAAAIPRRVASLRVNRAMAATRWVSIGQCPPSPSWRGQVGLREGRRHHAAHDLAVGAAARPRRQPAHDLAEVAGGRGAGRGDALVDEGGDLRLGQGLGQVVAEDVDLRLLLGREVLAPGPAERLDRLAARLDLAGQHGQELVVGQGLRLPLLDVVGGVDRHPQDVAAQRITAAHGGGDVGLDAISKGHRSWLPRAAVGRSSPAAATPAGRRSVGCERMPAQPACVRAFFLRFASLRLRFTDGFS